MHTHAHRETHICSFPNISRMSACIHMHTEKHIFAVSPTYHMPGEIRCKNTCTNSSVIMKLSKRQQRILYYIISRALVQFLIFISLKNEIVPVRSARRKPQHPDKSTVMYIHAPTHPYKSFHTYQTQTLPSFTPPPSPQTNPQQKVKLNPFSL